VLGKEPQVRSDVVIRDEERDADDSVVALRYWVPDFLTITVGLGSVGPGSDRMDYARLDPTNEPTLVTLTLDQIEERIAVGRLLAPITYTPERIHLVENQIDNLLCLSRRERNNIVDTLINNFGEGKRTDILDEDGDTIRDEISEELEEELERPPTDDEIQDAFDKRVDGLIDQAEAEYREEKFLEDLDDEIAQVLRFDLAPEEMVDLQLKGILLLEGKEIIERHNADGTITPYYRDHPDESVKDNLLSLPHYVPPYEPPE
jgi:hypothetical protein